MIKFNKNKMPALRDFLYHSNVHDANLETIVYKSDEYRITIQLVNSFCNIKYDFTFCNIKLFLSIKGNEYGSQKSVLSMTAEDDFSYLKKYMQNFIDDSDDYVYTVIQMFSGDELHIISKEIIVEITE